MSSSMDISPAEISGILKSQIENFGVEAEVSDVGQVLSVGDGIARIYGLDSVQAGEMVEFDGGIKGISAAEISIERLSSLHGGVHAFQFGGKACVNELGPDAQLDAADERGVNLAGKFHLAANGLGED